MLHTLEIKIRFSNDFTAKCYNRFSFHLDFGFNMYIPVMFGDLWANYFYPKFYFTHHFIRICIFSFKGRIRSRLMQPFEKCPSPPFMSFFSSVDLGEVSGRVIRNLKPMVETLKNIDGQK